jgi:Fur family ferric uptake transcriptional regulator
MPASLQPKPILERSTRQQTAILETLEGLDEFRSAQDIYLALTKKKFKVGLATVYRTLQKMAEKEEIDAIRGSDGETLYRHCGQGEGHHHHLICRDVSHQVDIFGLCQACHKVTR